MFADLDNPFGTDIFKPAATPRSTTYYRSMRLAKRPARQIAAPKPLSHFVKNLLLAG